MDKNLPPLPEPSEMDGARWGYTADDMQGHATDAYNAGWVTGRKALFEEMMQQAEPVADWKLVPVQATEDMLFAAEMSKPRGYHDLWSAMLSAAPLAAQQAKPLTEEEIYEMYSEPSSDAEMVEFARAIERAHGIGGDDGQA